MSPPTPPGRDPLETAEWLKRALSAARLGTWEWDVPRGTVVWSREVYGIFGVTEFGGTLASWTALVHPEDTAFTQSTIRGALGDRSSSGFLLEHRVLQPGGKVVWVEGRGQVLRDEVGAAVAVIGIVQDVTQRKELERQLAQSQRLETVGRLAGGVAHDFNNLLTAVIGGINLAQASATAEAQEDLSNALSAAQRAAGLTQRLLLFSKQRATDIRLLDLNEVLDGSQKMLSRVLRDDIRFSVRPGPRRMPVRGDLAQLEQVLVNLVINGAEAMPNGGELSVSTDVAEVPAGHAQLAPGRYFVVAVQDAGLGMSEAQRQRVLEPFFSTKPDGVGLGLSTSLSIVQRAQGTLEISSELGRGTTVSVYLPEAKPERKVTPAPSAAAFAGAKILIVEDDRAVRETTVRLLRRGGFEVTAAMDRAAALAAVGSSEDIDLVVTDVIMPDQSGPALVAQLRALRPDLLVLYVSGYAGEALQEHGVSEDDAFLQKPYSSELLIRRIRELLARRLAG